MLAASIEDSSIDEALAALESPKQTIRGGGNSQKDNLEGSGKLTQAIQALTDEIHQTCLVEQEGRTSLVKAIELLSAQLSRSLPTKAWEVDAPHKNSVEVSHEAKKEGIPFQVDAPHKNSVEASHEAKKEGIPFQATCKSSVAPIEVERTVSDESTTNGVSLCNVLAYESWNEIGKPTAPLPLGLGRDTTANSTANEVRLARPAEILDLEPRYEPHEFISTNNEEFTQWLPKVEASVKIYRVNEVDTASMTFQADFVIHLDWQDDNLKDFEGDLRLLDWDKKFFNPRVSIYNAKDVSEGWLDGADVVPRWYPSRKPPPGVLRHLRKTMRFRGMLYMSRADMRCFPFDVQFLPIHIKGAPCRNLENVIVNKDGSKVPKDAFKFYLDDSSIMACDRDYLDAVHKGCGNFVQKGAEDLLLDFGVAGINGQPGSDAYRVNIFVERPWLGSYSWNLIIMNVLAWLAGTSFWDGASPDVSSRMSITLTVILTIAVSQRPVAIEKTTYVTMNDQCQQMCLAIATIISFLNVMNVQICGGHHPESPLYMQDFFQEMKHLCEKSWCGTTWIDCHCFIFILVLWFGGLLFIAHWTYRRRHEVRKGLLGTPELSSTTSKLTRHVFRHHAAVTDLIMRKNRRRTSLGQIVPNSLSDS